MKGGPSSISAKRAALMGGLAAMVKGARMVFDAGSFTLIFTGEKGSEAAREAELRHERGETNVFIHPSLSEAYRAISEMRETSPQLLAADVRPELVVRSAYATLNVVQDEDDR